MEISIKNSTSLLVKSRNNSTELIFIDKGSLELVVNKERFLKSPGEFEFSGLGYVCLEVNDENKDGKINLVSMTDENNVSIAFIFDELINISTDNTDKIPNINVLVTTIENRNTFKDVMKVFQPDKVILISNHEIERNLYSDFNIIEGDGGKLKFSSSDFSDIEDSRLDLVLVRT